MSILSKKGDIYSCNKLVQTQSTYITKCLSPYEKNPDFLNYPLHENFK